MCVRERGATSARSYTKEMADGRRNRRGAPTVPCRWRRAAAATAAGFLALGSRGALAGRLTIGWNRFPFVLTPADLGWRGSVCVCTSGVVYSSEDRAVLLMGPRGRRASSRVVAVCFRTSGLFWCARSSFLRRTRASARSKDGVRVVRSKSIRSETPLEEEYRTQDTGVPGTLGTAVGASTERSKAQRHVRSVVVTALCSRQGERKVEAVALAVLSLSLPKQRILVLA